jgi:hypothetical protein
MLNKCKENYKISRHNQIYQILNNTTIEPKSVSYRNWLSWIAGHFYVDYTILQYTQLLSLVEIEIMWEVTQKKLQKQLKENFTELSKNKNSNELLLIKEQVTIFLISLFNSFNVHVTPTFNFLESYSKNYFEVLLGIFFFKKY